ncbi:hypothetical protein [Spirosoma foliorum]|uniref:Uncharacterized protein n=1 Tax=Spirosoma foliorum TaxID=2710596 RepID=A0A7G5GS38_9BACT|nr:hypothetical protein [Spirosoma foliorum]QMW01680.1 hypothetical protein H3H32_27565 [Spirosoma foliorum]
MTVTHAGKLLKYIRQLVTSPMLNRLVLQIVPPDFPPVGIHLWSGATAFPTAAG